MRKSIIIIALLLLTAITLIVYLSGSEKPNADLLGPRENTEAGIKIIVTYLPDITDATAFDIKVTSHMDYNDDFRNNSILRDPGGKIYKPISYEGSGGHHASGTLLFPKIESKKFEVVIQDVADIKERIFTW
jgi:hypothetical protein